MSQFHIGDNTYLSEDREYFDDFSDVESLKIVAKELVFIRKHIDKAMSRICVKIRKLEKSRKIKIPMKEKKQEKEQPMESAPPSQNPPTEKTKPSYSWQNALNAPMRVIPVTIGDAKGFKDIPEEWTDSFEDDEFTSTEGWSDQDFDISDESISREDTSQEITDYEDSYNDSDDVSLTTSSHETSESVLEGETSQKHHKQIVSNILKEAELENKLFSLRRKKKTSDPTSKKLHEDEELNADSTLREQSSNEDESITTQNLKKSDVRERATASEESNESSKKPKMHCSMPNWTNHQLYLMLRWLCENTNLNNQWNMLTKSKLLYGKNKNQMKKAFYSMTKKIPPNQDMQTYDKRAKYLLDNYTWDKNPR